MPRDKRDWCDIIFKHRRATPLPLASLIRDHFLEAIAHGDGDKDWSALAAVASRKAGLG